MKQRRGFGQTIPLLHRLWRLGSRLLVTNTSFRADSTYEYNNYRLSMASGLWSEALKGLCLSAEHTAKNTGSVSFQQQCSARIL